MPYEKVKIYSDGSHYIGIPKSQKPPPKRPKSKSEKNELLKEEFNKAYRNAKGKGKKEKTKDIKEDLSKYFDNEEELKAFIDTNMERSKRNLIVRTMRLTRKINLGTWNYFCTFTYDDKKHTEQSFKKKLSDCFKKMCYRRGWKYIGVWERSPKNNRLHFHGIFNIPENAMVGELVTHRDYSTKSHVMQTTVQNTYFTERFGRNDFSEIEPNGFSGGNSLGQAAAYIIKYIHKSKERIVYSRGTPTYFESDILDDDVVCTIGQEDRKLLLFDNFACIKDGEYIGQVGPEVIEQMPKSN